MDRCGVGTCNTVRVQWNVSNRLGVEKHLLNYRRWGGYFRNFWVGMCRWDPGNCLKTIPSPRHIPILPIFGSTPPPPRYRRLSPLSLRKSPQRRGTV